jgi:hypothetical protein
MGIINRLFGYPRPSDLTLWHKCPPPLFARKDIHGEWILGTGTIWRRKFDGKWQYQQDSETADQWDSRQF